MTRSPRRRDRALPPTRAGTAIRTAVDDAGERRRGGGPAVPAAPPKVMIVGDSVAGTLGLGYQNLGAASGLTVWNRGRLGCGLFYDGSVFEGGQLHTVDSSKCNWRDKWPGELALFKPDVVVMLVGTWDILDREVDGHEVKFGSVEYDSLFLHQLDDATNLLASTGAKVDRADHPVLLAPELRGPDRYAVARVRPVARRSHQLARTATSSTTTPAATT